MKSVSDDDEVEKNFDVNLKASLKENKSKGKTREAGARKQKIGGDYIGT